MRLIIAGGKTGGHLFPGIALADAVVAQDESSKVQFVGTEAGIEARVLPPLGWDLVTIDISGLKTVGWRGMLRGALRIPKALWQSRRILKAFRPDVVVGVGGYASGPVVLMARWLGIRTAILEQNSIPGLTNRVLGRFVDRIFISFDVTRRFFAAKKTVLSGNPIRKALVHPEGQDTAERSLHAPPLVFVFGGSQGAVAVNRLFVEAAALLASRGCTFRILHQTGRADLETTQKAYQDAGITASCTAFIEDMAAAYRSADLVISRAGATTVAELGCMGRAAILIPYPYAADNHQEINAQELGDKGAALVFRQAELSPVLLAQKIEQLLGDLDARARMESAMNALGRANAAETIVSWLRGQGRD